MTITTIGLGLAKSVFQAHGIDESGATGEEVAPEADAVLLLEAVAMPDRCGGV